MRRKVFFITFIVSVCLIEICLAKTNQASVINLNSQIKRLDLAPYLHWLIDTRDQICIEDVTNNKVKFNTPLDKTLNFGFSKSTYWLKMSLNSSNIEKTSFWYIHLQYPLLNKIDFYILKDNKINHIQTGLSRPFSNRPLHHPDFIFPIQINPNDTITIYIKAKSNSSVQFPMTLWEPSAFCVFEILMFMGTASLYVFFIFISLLNIILFWIFRYRTCLIYAFFIMTYVLFHMAYKGVSAAWLWPQWNTWSIISVPIFISLTSLAAILFTKHFLKIKEQLFQYNKIFQAGIIVSVAGIFIVFVGPYEISIKLNMLILFLQSLLILITIIASLRKGLAQSKFFLIAWLTVFTGVITYSLKTIGVLPSNFLIEKSVEIGYFLCVFMLGFSLLEQFQKERTQQKEMQKQAVIERKQHAEIQANTMKTLDQKAKDLHEISINLSGQIDHLNVESDTVAGASEEMSANIETIASSMEELSVNIKSISKSSEKMSLHNNSVANSIQELTSAMNEISGHAQNGSNIAAKVVSMAGITSQTMKSLGVAADQIGSVTEVIKKIAEKTDILAVNAAIEAASAGEAGKGFAVVANEITKFSEQSARAAEDIAKRIAGAQEQTQKAITDIFDMQKVIESMNQSSESISQAVENQTLALHDISDNASQANIQSDEIAHLMSEMSLVSDDVSKNAVEASKGINEIARSIRTVNMFGQELLNICQRIEKEAQHMIDVKNENPLS
jgi:methyl-accepting chemotaxis protein